MNRHGTRHSCEQRFESVATRASVPRSFIIACAIFLYAGCNSAKATRVKGAASTPAPEPTPAQTIESMHIHPASDLRLRETVVRRILQDRTGTYWFGTNGRGVVRYDGGTPEYFSIDEGFGGWAVREIVEDNQGNIWFATSGGISKYDGDTFINYTESDGLVANDAWSLEIDRDGIIWVGTIGGVSRFDGDSFSRFELPESEPDLDRGVTSPWIVHNILEDSRGWMWFAANSGAYIDDGKTLWKLSEEAGLCNNAVNGFLEDKHGHIWFATHHNGVCRWDGTAFTHFDEHHGVKGSEAWKLYQDRVGNIWFPVEHAGVYRFDGGSLTNFHRAQGLQSDAIQVIYEDRDGQLWFGGWMTLFCYDGVQFYDHTESSAAFADTSVFGDANGKNQ